MTVTENGMPVRVNSANACVDLFYAAGAMRGKDIVPQFVSALVEDENIAGRIALWLRDVRAGAGERELFRNILRYLEIYNPELAVRLALRVPELGRWDDLLVFDTERIKLVAYQLIAEALAAGNGLAAKWMPRKGAEAARLRKFLNLTPKAYRKTLVNLTKVVETQMCAKQWETIEFSHVPSQAHAKYKRAFARNSLAYKAYVAKLVSKDASVKINASAIYPYEVIKDVHILEYAPIAPEVVSVTIAQWDALPNYLGSRKVLPMVDVSGSMVCPAGSNTSVSCMDVAVSLGLYCAEKNTGAYKGVFLTFSEQPELVQLKGNVVQMAKQMTRSNWGMNTDISAAFARVLQLAQAQNAAQADMPEFILIFSDMQFDACVSNGSDSALAMMQRRYEAAGYTMPKVVFWNLRHGGNTPVKYDEKNTALVSGFSPNIMKAIFSSDLDQFSPVGIMMETLKSERYDF